MSENQPMPTDQDKGYGSRKFVVAIVVVVGATASNLLGHLDSWHTAALIGSVACIYIGGQALVDAAAHVAIAKFGPKQ